MNEADLRQRLIELRSQSWFRTFIEEHVKANMPDVPRWTPVDDNTELWKAASMKREGYILALMQFGFKPEDLT